jgi:hypothetical protein
MRAWLAGGWSRCVQSLPRPILEFARLGSLPAVACQRQRACFDAVRCEASDPHGWVQAVIPALVDVGRRAQRREKYIPTSVSRIRAGAVALAAVGVLFLAYPALRPWHDENLATGATASMSSTAWVAAHFLAMAGFTLMPVGLLAVRAAVAATRAEPLALAAAMLAWIGSDLTLPYYGAEDFGLHAIARLDGHGPGLLALVHAVRYQPLAVTIFGARLALIAAAAIMVATAVWRSHVLPAANAVLFAAGFALFLPQFFSPPAIRIGHGILLAAGSIILAAALWTSAGRHHAVHTTPATQLSFHGR